MAYTKNLPDSNSSYSAELAKCCAPEINGDSQVLVEVTALVTAITSGTMMSLIPTSSGWVGTTVIDSVLHRIGIAQGTPSSVGDRIQGCVGGFTYAHPSSAVTCTAWAQEVDITSQEITPQGGAATSISTMHIGWCVSSGAVTTANGFVLFMDTPWRLVDATTA